MKHIKKESVLIFGSISLAVTICYRFSSLVDYTWSRLKVFMMGPLDIDILLLLGVLLYHLTLTCVIISLFEDSA